MQPLPDIELSLIRHERDLLALGPEWDDLLERSGMRHLFLTWEYLSTWWEVYGFGLGFGLCWVVARDRQGVLRGVAPTVIGPGLGPARRWLRHLTLMGGECDSTAVYGGFVIERGWESVLAPRFLHRLLGRDLAWDVMRFGYARNGAALDASLRFLGDRHPRLRRHATWRNSLDATWESYEQRVLSGHRRSQLRRSEKKLRSVGPVRVLEAGIDLEPTDALEHLVRLNRERWGDRGRSFHTPRYVEFHRRLAPRLAARDWLSFRLLEVGGQIVGARYDFVHAGCLTLFQSGWARSHADHSPGQIMLADSIRRAMERGLERIDFLTGDSPYKASWAQRSESVLDVEIPRPGNPLAWAAWTARGVIGLVHRPDSATASHGAPEFS